MSNIQEGASLNPGDEEDFIRQLQAQLAGEAAADGGASGGDTNGSPLGDLSSMESAETNADSSSNVAADLLSNKPKRDNIIEDCHTDLLSPNGLRLKKTVSAVRHEPIRVIPYKKGQ